jgi:hypothetical protein
MAPDYVQEESLNENAEIDWVNKVNSSTKVFYNYIKNVSGFFSFVL